MGRASRLTPGERSSSNLTGGTRALEICSDHARARLALQSLVLQHGDVEDIDPDQPIVPGEPLTSPQPQRLDPRILRYAIGTIALVTGIISFLVWRSAEEEARFDDIVSAVTTENDHEKAADLMDAWTTSDTALRRNVMRRLDLKAHEHGRRAAALAAENPSDQELTEARNHFRIAGMLFRLGRNTDDPEGMALRADAAVRNAGLARQQGASQEAARLFSDAAALYEQAAVRYRALERPSLADECAQLAESCRRN